MNDKRDDNGELLPGEKRLNSFGILIRKTSIDELPQLLNILHGDMSLVGPRPLLPEYLQLYNEHQRKRHEVKPGITGLAQINGRNAITWDKKFDFDIYYVENLSFKLDTKIILMTLGKVFKTSDVNQNDIITMEKFNGN